jgi:hypothetical protein
MTAPLLSLASIVLGLALVLADHRVSRALLRISADPESGATTARILGLILLVAGGVGLLAWAP